MSERVHPTSRTLLQRLKDGDDDAAWRTFLAIYAPLLEGFARSLGAGGTDAEEIRDECLALVATKLRTFEYDPRRGRFQGWLYELARGRVIDRRRRRVEPQLDSSVLLAAVGPEPSPEHIWDELWREAHFRFALDQAAEGVSERAYQVFELLLLDELSVTEVCERMGMNANQVYKAKSRVLARVRDVLERLGGWEERGV